MVHALEEIRRALVAGGTLVDLRPHGTHWSVRVLSSRGDQDAGLVTHLREDLEDDAAADRAMAAGESAGLFRREREESFPFRYSWDSPKEMQEYLAEEWTDVAVVDENVWARLRSLWAVSDGDARVGVDVEMLITRWAKID